MKLRLQYFGGRGSGGGKASGGQVVELSKQEMISYERKGASFIQFIDTDEKRIDMLEKMPEGAGFNLTYKNEDYFELKNKYKSPGLRYSSKADVESSSGKVYDFFKEANGIRVRFDNDTEKTFKSAQQAVNSVNRDAGKKKVAMSAFWRP